MNEALPAQSDKRFKITAEIGRSGLRKYSGYIDEEFDPNLRGIRGMRKFEEMRRNDPDIGAVLLAIEMSLHSVDWYVEPGGDTKPDLEAAEFLRTCMEDMSESPSDLLSDIMTMFPFGFSLLETVYKLRAGPSNSKERAPSKFDDGRIGWRKFAIRNQETIQQWAFDEAGGLLGAWQQLAVGDTNRIFLPIDKCLLFTTKRERGNPEGYSILRNAYRQYYLKTNLEEIEAISAERDMTGVPWIKLPLGATSDDTDAALDILEKLKWDDQAGLVLPRMGQEEHMWWEFGITQSGGSPRINTNEVIQRAATAIARSTLAQFLMLGSQGVGSYALSSDHSELFHIAAKGYLDRIEETFNRFAVDRLFALNDFNDLTSLPKWKHGRVGKRQLNVFTESLEKLVKIGMPLTIQDWNILRNEVELPELSEEELEEMEAQEEQREEQQQTPEQEKPAPTEQPNENETEQGQNKTTSENWFSRTFKRR